MSQKIFGMLGDGKGKNKSWREGVAAESQAAIFYILYQESLLQIKWAENKRKEVREECQVDACRGRAFHTEERTSAEGPETGWSLGEMEKQTEGQSVTGAEAGRRTAGDEFRGE